ncbi:hypothetical protein M601_002235 [Cellulophaga baltica 4]|nr:hypothetical protein M601_002235 [Cellulophaga baltica 4]
MGEGYSHQLNDKNTATDLLKAQGLPVLDSANDIAKAMKISLGELRFLAYSRKNSKNKPL